MPVTQGLWNLFGRLQKQGARSALETIQKRVALRSIALKLRGQKGIEIGGPSGVFARNSLIPIYPLVDELDNCNFSDNTIWEGTIAGGRSFRFDAKRQPGRQYISEATELNDIASGTYDFVASSYVLEHVANPLKALHEWSRISKPTGKLLLVLPHRDGTFDHRRPVTSIDHMVSDYESKVGEDDTTHLSEVLDLHDIEVDPAVTHREELVARFQANSEIVAYIITSSRRDPPQRYWQKRATQSTG